MLGVCGSIRILAVHQARLALLPHSRVTCFRNARPDWLRRYKTLQFACSSSTAALRSGSLAASCRRHATEAFQMTHVREAGEWNAAVRAVPSHPFFAGGRWGTMICLMGK